MKSVIVWSKYKKYILSTLIFIQTFFMTTPSYAYEVFSDWDDVKNYVYENMIDRKTEIEFTYKGDSNGYAEKLKDVLKQAYSDDDYLERSWTEIKPKAHDTKEGIKTTLNIKYLCNKDEENYIDRELKKAVHSIINDNMSDYEKVKAINDYIIERYEYDNDLKSLSVYSALTTSEAVCQGYAMTAYKMLNYAGISNRIIVGTAKGIAHSWNIVEIDGKWYQLDITNNDSVANRNKYFLVSDEFLINNNYKWDSKMYNSALENYKDL